MKVTVWVNGKKQDNVRHGTRVAYPYDRSILGPYQMSYVNRGRSLPY